MLELEYQVSLLLPWTDYFMVELITSFHFTHDVSFCAGQDNGPVPELLTELFSKFSFSCPLPGLKFKFEVFQSTVPGYNDIFKLLNSNTFLLPNENE